MTIVDARERGEAIDPLRSFCIGAPAGSGKTELLIQRLLALLARVQSPEQILAITFTRKAAAEMRDRVVVALQEAKEQQPCSSDHQRTTRQLAEQALRVDAEHDWNLLQNMNRLSIKTIDSFCGGLTRQMPVLSNFGGQAAVLDNAQELYTEAVQDLFDLLGSDYPIAADLQALLLHFDNNWEKLQALLVLMLGRREQWLEYMGVRSSPEESEDYLLQTVDLLVQEALQEIKELIRPFASELLEVQNYAASNLGLTEMAGLPTCSADNLQQWRSLRDLLLTKSGQWRKKVTVREGFPAGKGAATQRKEQLYRLIAAMQEQPELEQRELVQKLNRIMILPEMQASSVSWELVVHLAHVLPVLAAQLLLVFSRRGMVDHAQVTVSALQALGEDDMPTDLALRLDYQIEHVLLDEFQDTAISQYQLVNRLTRGWGLHNAENPEAPRTIMVVGDAMQSIYGFRDANVGLFLRAKEFGFNGVALNYLALRSNFRSEAGIVNWVNSSFEQAFPAADEAAKGRVAFASAVAVKPPGNSPAVTMHGFCGEDARNSEVQMICDQIALGVADVRCSSIAVLGRSRSHLQPILRALKSRQLGFSAQDLDSLASSPAIIDLMTLCRALLNSADRVAWLAVLRAPWCGLKLSDLLIVARWGDRATYASVPETMAKEGLLDALSDDGQCRVEHVLKAVTQALALRDRLSLRVWIEQLWLKLGGPEALEDNQQLEDAESFFVLLQSAEREGVGLNLAWLEQKLMKLYANAHDAEAKIQLMTLHKAKGLEFDWVIIPALGRPGRSDDRQLLLWDEYSGADLQPRFLLAADDHSAPTEPTLYNFLQRQREEKARLEATRLLYVGATRAVQRLVLTCELVATEDLEDFRDPQVRSLLSSVWPTFCSQMEVHHVDAVTDPDPDRAIHEAPKLHRLMPAMLDTSGTITLADDLGVQSNAPQRLLNAQDRHVGTVVHQALENLAARELLPDALEQSDIDRWENALRSLGINGSKLKPSLAAVVQCVNATLADSEHGRWILMARGEDKCEWELISALEHGQFDTLIIDRYFLDEATGIRWLIDYKSSRPAQGQSLDSFFKDEKLRYSPQLQRYRSAILAMDSRPIRCALYFAALGKLQVIETLNFNPVEI